jgi:hypothetical protein
LYHQKGVLLAAKDSILTKAYAEPRSVKRVAQKSNDTHKAQGPRHNVEVENDYHCLIKNEGSTTWG